MTVQRDEDRLAPPTPRRAPTWALVAMTAAGVVGAAYGLAELLVRPAVPAAQLSYPFASGPFVLGQVLLCLHHLVVGLGVVAVFRSGVAGFRRTATAGTLAAVLGLVLLAAMELVAAGEASRTSGTAPVDAGFGIATVLLGTGLVIAGTAVVRAGVWRGWRRWLPLAIGVYEFVPLIPATTGPFVPGVVALGVWSLLFTALGAAALSGTPARAGRTTAASTPSRPRRAPDR